MQDCAIAAEGRGQVNFPRKVTGCASRVYWERKSFVDLCRDGWFENEGDIIVVGMDVPEGSAVVKTWKGNELGVF